MRRRRQPVLEPVRVHTSVDRVTLQAAAATDRFCIVSGGGGVYQQQEQHRVAAIHAALVAAAVRDESVTIVMDQGVESAVDCFFPKDAVLYNHGSSGVVLWAKVCWVVRSPDAAFRFSSAAAPQEQSHHHDPPNSTHIAVGGNDEAQRAIQDAFLCHPKLVAWGWEPPTGILLYGPPGCGKTLLVRSMLQDVATVVHLKSTDVAHATVGSGEKTIAKAFSRARQKPPSVVFIDEFQALFVQRSSGSSSRVTTTLLQCMDDLVRWRQAGADQVRRGDKTTNLVIVIAATNTPWLVDRAFLRPGRLDRTLHVRLPSENDRKQILQVQMRSMKTKFNAESSVDEFCTQLARKTKSFSGADCGSLCRAAAVNCLLENRTFVREDDFLGVLAHGEVQPSTSETLLQQINAWSLR